MVAIEETQLRCQMDCIELHACGRTNLDRASLCASIIGVSVIGAYLLASGAAFAEAAPQLCALAKALRTDVGDDSLLLHIDDTSGKVRIAKLAMHVQSCTFSPIPLRRSCKSMCLRCSWS